ncbi:MAG: DUF922 domain-containing protein [Pseudomonadota bacterium]
MDVRLAALVSAIAIALTAGPAVAKKKTRDVNIQTVTKFYAISGETPAELAKSMRRYGPYSSAHGRRVFATTNRVLRWNIDHAYENGICRVKRATIDLKITYNMPKLRDGIRMRRSVRNTWRQMYRLLDRHEKVHGANYRRLARDSYKALKSLKSEKSCRVLHRKGNALVLALAREDVERNARFERSDTRNYRRMDRLIKR